MLDDHSNRLKIPPVLFLILAMTFTGANVPLGKFIVEDMPVFLFLGVRFAIATATLAFLLRHKDWRALMHLDRRQNSDVLILAGVGSLLFTVLLLEGTKRTSATEAGIIAATLPAVVAILAIVFMRARVTRRGSIAIGLSILGLVVIQSSGPETLQLQPIQTSLLGNALVLGAVICEAVFVLRSKDISQRVSPIALSLAVSATSLLLALPLILIELYHVGIAAYVQIPVTTWLAAAWYALTASVFCTVLWYAGVGRVEAWQAGLATTAIPVTAIAVAAILLGEVLTSVQAAGAVLVIAAITMGATTRDSRPTHVAAPSVDGHRRNRSDTDLT